jgi:hypothetical protein
MSVASLTTHGSVFLACLKWWNKKIEANGIQNNKKIDLIRRRMYAEASSFLNPVKNLPTLLLLTLMNIEIIWIMNYLIDTLK